MFTGYEITYFSKDYGIQLIRSIPFYAQENGQAETSNKVLINILEKMLEDNPIDWHIILVEILWAYRTSKKDSIVLLSNIWTRCSASNEGGSSFSKSIQTKQPISSRIQ